MFLIAIVSLGVSQPMMLPPQVPVMRPAIVEPISRPMPAAQPIPVSRPMPVAQPMPAAQPLRLAQPLTQVMSTVPRATRPYYPFEATGSTRLADPLTACYFRQLEPSAILGYLAAVPSGAPCRTLFLPF